MYSCRRYRRCVWAVSDAARAKLFEFFAARRWTKFAATTPCLSHRTTAHRFSHRISCFLRASFFACAFFDRHITSRFSSVCKFSILVSMRGCGRNGRADDRGRLALPTHALPFGANCVFGGHLHVKLPSVLVQFPYKQA